MNDKILLNGKELAKALQISHNTFFQWIKNEELPHVVLNGRKYYTLNTVVEWMENKAVNNV